MRFISVLLLSLFVYLGATDINVYSNGAIGTGFADYSWADKMYSNSADSTTLYKGSPSYSFKPQYYSGLYFACQSCINVTKADSVVVYVNFGNYINTVLSVSLVKNAVGGTVNYPALINAPSLSTFATSAIIKNSWIRCVIPATQFGAGTYDGIQLIGNVNVIQNIIWIGSVVVGQYASGFLNINGNKGFALGVNLPYSNANNFGRDFGKNAWGYSGVNTLYTFNNVTAAFKSVNKNYGNTVRWNLFTDARAGIVFNTDGTPASLNTEVFNDMDKAVTIAKGYKTSICFSILDVTFFQNAVTSNKVVLGGHSDIVTDPAKTQAFINVVLLPILKRYGSNPAIFAWEVISNVEKIIADLPDGSPFDPTLFGLVTMQQFWTFMNTVAKQIKATTTVGQQVTMGSLSLKWINLYTPTYAAANNLPSLLLDYYSVGYDTWMDSVSYNNDTVFGTVNGSPYQQNVGDLDALEGKPVVVIAVSTPATNFTLLYNTLARNGYAGVFENYATISLTRFAAWGASNVNVTNWAGVQNPILIAPLLNVSTTANTTAPTPIPTGIPSDITFIPTVIYDDEVNAAWMDYSWAVLRNPSATTYVYSGSYSYSFAPSTYDGLYFVLTNGINTGTDFAITFYIHGGTSSGQLINFAIVDSQGKKAGGGGVSLAAVGVTVAPKWQRVVVPLKNFPLGKYSGIQIYGAYNGEQSPVFVDQVTLLSYPAKATTTNSGFDSIQSPASSVTVSTIFTFAVVSVALLFNLFM